MPNLSAGIENRNIRYFTAYGHCNAYGHTAVNRSITATLADDNKLAMLLDRGAYMAGLYRPEQPIPWDNCNL